jgi:hypothetical protein
MDDAAVRPCGLLLCVDGRCGIRDHRRVQIRIGLRCVSLLQHCSMLLVLLHECDLLLLLWWWLCHLDRHRRPRCCMGSGGGGGGGRVDTEW